MPGPARHITALITRLSLIGQSRGRLPGQQLARARRADAIGRGQGIPYNVDAIHGLVGGIPQVGCLGKSGQRLAELLFAGTEQDADGPGPSGDAQQGHGRRPSGTISQGGLRPRSAKVIPANSGSAKIGGRGQAKTGHGQPGPQTEVSSVNDSSGVAGMPISARDRHVTASSNQTFSTKVACFTRPSSVVREGTKRPARLLLGQPVQAPVERTAVLVEEHLELRPGWLIDDVPADVLGREDMREAFQDRAHEQLAHIGSTERPSGQVGAQNTQFRMSPPATPGDADLRHNGGSVRALLVTRCNCDHQCAHAPLRLADPDHACRHSCPGPSSSRHERAFPGHDGLHKYAGHARYRAMDTHDGRNADDVISRPNKRAPTRR